MNTLSTSPDILIVRHGETVWNRDRRMQGRQDSPLTDRGQDQADRLGTELTARDLLSGRRVLVSPAGRTRSTAERLLGRALRDADYDSRLVELGLGEWEGWTVGMIRAAAPHLFIDDLDPYEWLFQAPGGEGYDAITARCRAVLSDLDEPVLIVTHGVTSRVLRMLALGQDRSGLAALPGGQGNAFHLLGEAMHEVRPAG